VEAAVAEGAVADFLAAAVGCAQVVEGGAARGRLSVARQPCRGRRGVVVVPPVARWPAAAIGPVLAARAQAEE
jgi:hypothetical protein